LEELRAFMEQVLGQGEKTDGSDPISQ
jgi:hypothetical protein